MQAIRRTSPTPAESARIAGREVRATSPCNGAIRNARFCDAYSLNSACRSRPIRSASACAWRGVTPASILPSSRM